MGSRGVLVMDGQENRHQALCLLAALVTIGGPAMGQPFFYARDFQLTLQFQPGRDIWVESSGIPMTMSPGGTYVAGTFQISGLDFQGFLRKYDSAGKDVWARQLAAADSA